MEFLVIHLLCLLYRVSEVCSVRCSGHAYWQVDPFDPNVEGIWILGIQRRGTRQSWPDLPLSELSPCYFTDCAALLLFSNELITIDFFYHRWFGIRSITAHWSCASQQDWWNTVWRWSRKMILLDSYRWAVPQDVMQVWLPSSSSTVNPQICQCLRKIFSSHLKLSIFSFAQLFPKTEYFITTLPLMSCNPALCHETRKSNGIISSKTKAQILCFYNLISRDPNPTIPPPMGKYSVVNKLERGRKESAKHM